MTELELLYFLKEVPGFTVLLELGYLFAAIRKQAHGLYVFESAWREDVPSVLGHDVGDQQIDFIGAVGLALVAVGADVISAASLGTDTMGRLNLHAQETSADIDDEVVTIAIPPGFGDSETHGGGLAQEGGLSNLPATFGFALYLLGSILLRRSCAFWRRLLSFHGELQDKQKGAGSVGSLRLDCLYLQNNKLSGVIAPT